MSSLFTGTAEQPYHLSIGAVLLNSAGEVCTHYFDRPPTGDPALQNFYILMRETMEAGESVEQTLHRGLKEEFSATATVEHYLGPIVSHFTYRSGQPVEKTTLYFQCRLLKQDVAGRDPEDPEAGSEIRWVEPGELIRLMQKQGERVGRSDIDEAAIVARIID